jgi:hypothetical protein
LILCSVNSPFTETSSKNESTRTIRSPTNEHRRTATTLHQRRLGGIAAVLETRLHQAQAEPMAPIDLISCLISDELTRRSDRLLERRRKQAGFRDANRTLDSFDFTFNPKMNRSLIFDLAACGFIGKTRGCPEFPPCRNQRGKVKLWLVLITFSLAGFEVTAIGRIWGDH